jgi:hypothetical protein
VTCVPHVASHTLRHCRAEHTALVRSSRSDAESSLGVGQVSPPLVAFKESVARSLTATTVHPPPAEATTPNGLCTLRVWALALPGATTRVLQESEPLLRQTHSGAQAGANPHWVGSVSGGVAESLDSASVYNHEHLHSGQHQNQERKPTSEAEVVVGRSGCV